MSYEIFSTMVFVAMVLFMGYLFCENVSMIKNLKRLQKKGILTSNKGTYTFTPHSPSEVKK